LGSDLQVDEDYLVEVHLASRGGSVFCFAGEWPACDAEKLL